MAMLPALVNNGVFSDLFDDPFFNGWHRSSRRDRPVVPMGMMRTDVKESDKSYDVTIDMPGFSKDDIGIELHDGYVTVSAHKDEEDDEKNKEGKWIRRERYLGSCSRSFYVGDQIKESDIHAAYKNGTLTLQIAKVLPEPKVETKHQIAIDD